MYQSCEPDPRLTPFVECYWTWQLEPGEADLDDILPDAAPEFIVHLGAIPSIALPSGKWQQQYRAFLYCAANAPLRLSIQKPVRIFAIRFRPWGVARFTGQSMVGKLDHMVPPDDILPALGNNLARTLLNADSDAQRVKETNGLLIDALQNPASNARRLEQLLEAINGGQCSATEMARTLAMSDRSFRRLWSDVVGIPPRKFIQLMRFHKALEKIDAGEKLVKTAQDCGYSDQPHMARQIRSISGLSATALRRRLGNRVYRDLYASRPGAPWHTSPGSPGIEP